METSHVSPTESAFIEELSRGAAAILLSYFESDLEPTFKADASIVTAADLASEKFIVDKIRKYYPDDLIYAEESGLSSVARPVGQYIWIIDPLDGTSNFFNGLPFFAVSIARARILANGTFDVVLGSVTDPLRGRYYSAVRGGGAKCNGKPLQIKNSVAFERAFLVTGIAHKDPVILERDLRILTDIVRRCHNVRRDGSAALDMALVASGVYDGFWEHGLSPWDVAAGCLLVSEAGGLVINYECNLTAPFNVERPGLICGNHGIVENLRDYVAKNTVGLI